MQRKPPRFLVIIFALTTIFYATTGFGGPQIPGFYGTVPNLPTVAPNALPSVKGIIQGVSSVDQISDNQLVIHQSQEKAIIDWHTFNIGEQASTHFDQQKNTNWAALNRIYDKNPSQILGQLSADGRIYLINQNGILFGPNSQVNVHSLIGSSLNTTNDDFLNGVLKFKVENYTGDPDFSQAGAVSNHGIMVTDELGSVFLLAPTVENSGAINTPVGQIGLAAGTEVEIAPDSSTNTTRTAQVVNVKSGAGEATNFENGRLTADTGTVGMYGNIVRQDGLIRSVTAVKQRGNIELMASEKIVTGEKSLTWSPVTDSDETVHQSFQFQGGRVRMDGLDPRYPLYPQSRVGTIQHAGVVAAPSGLVEMKAQDRVFLDKNSRVDVSGAWVNEDADTNVVLAKLNSVELRDDFGQKNRNLLGETVSIHTLRGSSIGDVSGSLSGDEITALEQASKGGQIFIEARSGYVIVKEEAVIDFSGGGVRYGEGYVETSKLVAGNKLYDISDAPQWLNYSRILDAQHPHKRHHSRYNITEEYEGLNYGGAAPLKDFAAAHIEGSDAGTLSIVARRVVLDGSLNGSVLEGIYQTDPEEPKDERGNQTAVGWKEPEAGTLIIGSAPTGESAELRDLVLDDVVLRSEVKPLPEDFGPEDSLPILVDGIVKKTYLAASVLNNSGVGTLNIFTNTKFTTEKDAILSLRPGATLAVTARAIEHRGDIQIAGGSVTLALQDNLTGLPQIGGKENPRYVALPQRIYLEQGGTISTGGERLDNFSLDGTLNVPEVNGHTTGGSVTLEDSTALGDGVVVKQGAVIDVTGGYEIDRGGKILGGDAGKLSVRGPGVLLEGNLKGHSLEGNDGGTIALHANEVVVTTDASSGLSERLSFDSNLPIESRGKLILQDDRLMETGFARIELASVYDLTISSGSDLTVSNKKTSHPVPGSRRGVAGQGADYVATIAEGQSNHRKLVTLSSDYLGNTAIVVRAGKDLPGVSVDDNVDARVVVETDARIHTASQGDITLEGPALTMSGSVDAPAGTVTLKSTAGALHVTGSGRISAAGRNIQDGNAILKDLPAEYTPLDGGKVTLQASNGDLIIDAGSLIDVSGSSPVTSYMQNMNGTVSTVSVASDPGSVTLAFAGVLQLEGEMTAGAKIDGLRGGALSIGKRNLTDSLTVTANEILDYQSRGFDDLTFRSWRAVEWVGSMDLDIGRKISLDAPEILASNNDRIDLRAPWISLTNTYWPISKNGIAGNGTIHLSAQWLDITGSVAFSGVQNVRLESSTHMPMADYFYELEGQLSQWKGGLTVPGDLTLTADRIYPTTLSDFVVEAAGNVTTLPTGQAGQALVFSAGGSLTIKGQNIDHHSTLAAPMGEIVLNATDRIYLADGSIITTKGDAPVLYGDLDEQFWTIPDKATGLAIDVEQEPEKSVLMTADEVIVRENASIDVSGGGEMFSYQFLPSAQGSVNPLQKKGCYVIMADNSIPYPGEAVYLAGGEGIEEGVYSLLPEEYAFLPGAMVITDLGEMNFDAASITGLSEAGYPVVSGYAMVMGTEVRSAKQRGYLIRPASEVMKEGFFGVAELAAVNGGIMDIQGNTAILNGKIEAAPLEGGSGGTFSISGKRIKIGSDVAALPKDFGFEDLVPSNLQGSANLKAEAFSGKGFSVLALGNTSITESLEVLGGSILEADSVHLAAGKTITIHAGGEIHAVGKEGTATLSSPSGLLTVHEDALVHASHTINVAAQDVDLQGDLVTDNSSLNLTGEAVCFIPEGYTEDLPDGMHLTDKVWSQFDIFEEITITSETDVLFLGDFDITVGELLTIDAGRLAATDAEGDLVAQVTINAATLQLLNTGTQSTDGTLADTGRITFNASEIMVGKGDIILDGFAETTLNSSGGLGIRGVGSLSAAGDLNLNASRITAVSYRDATTPYDAPDFVILAQAGEVFLGAGPNGSGLSSVPGGKLEIAARSITQRSNAIIDFSSGQITYRATGSEDGDGIFLHAGAQILAQGSRYAPGGTITLDAQEGSVTVETDAVIDVSAGTQGDAGAIEIEAPKSELVLSGDLLGNGDSGSGGSFLLDTLTMGTTPAGENYLSVLSDKLQQGGFNHQIAIRARTDDIIIEADASQGAPRIMAHQFKLVADGGDILVDGTVNASGDREGGSIELIAKENLILNAGSSLEAKGLYPDASGGQILLQAGDLDASGAPLGELDFKAGASVNVSGGSEAEGGRVDFRALRTETNDDMYMRLDGTVIGARHVAARGVQVYKKTGDYSINSNDLSKTAVGGWYKEAEAFTAQENVNAMLVNTLHVDTWNTEFLLIPDIEIRATGDLTLATTWDLTSWRFNGTPGSLTLRAGDELKINQNLVDYPTPLNTLQSSATLDSWGLQLTAGADLTSADAMAFVPGTGKLTVADGRMVYSESASVRFASGDDVVIGPGASTGYMINSSIRYNVGTYDSSIRGQVGGDLIIRGGAIQAATGDIVLTIGKDLILQQAQDFGAFAGSSFTSLGSIRTTGETSERLGGLSKYWNYGNGGDIVLQVGGRVAGNLVNDAWDQAYGSRPPRRWAASYQGSNSTEGLAAMGGGNLVVHAGGDFFCQAGAFGKGDLTLSAGGDIDGRFLVKGGTGNLHAAGNFGTRLANQSIDAFDARINVCAQGDIDLGTIVNPTIVRELLNTHWDLQYSQDASVRLHAVTGDVTLTGDSGFYNLGASYSKLERILPPSLEIEAAGDIRLLNEFALVPSSTGNLTLTAGGSLDGRYATVEYGTTFLKRASISVSDMDSASVYGYRPGFQPAAIFSRYEHAGTPVHLDDPFPVVIQAGEDVKNLQLYLPKKIKIRAHRDVKDIYCFGQNISPQDTSLIKAGRDIFFSSLPGTNYDTGVVWGGPGQLIVQAAENIDMGTTKGIQTVGNSFNTALAEKGCSLILSAGYDKEYALPEVETLFDALRDRGVEYSTLLAEGSLADADEIVEMGRQEIIKPFFGDQGSHVAGNIDMTTSQISTSSANDDVFVIAKGNVNLGKSAFVADEDRRNTGIYTAAGGSVNVFSGGDVNVNESRVMTFRGGDITMWSDEGNINAGRGSKTAISVDPPKVQLIGDAYVLVFSPPAVGSGIRTLTYDPDGVAGPAKAPLAGDVFLFAPSGEIDAAEGEISGRNVILGATRVLNTQNISFTAGSVGVPVASEAGPSLGALAGMGNITDTSKLAEEAAGMTEARERMAQDAEAMAQAFTPKWLKVEFVGFDEETTIKEGEQ